MDTGTTKIVQITLIDAGGFKKTLNIDNPRNDIAVAMIKNVLTPIISKGFWLGSSGAPVVGVGEIYLQTTDKTKLDPGEVSYLPTTLSTHNSNVNLYVDVNSPVTLAQFEMVEDGSAFNGLSYRGVTISPSPNEGDTRITINQFSFNALSPVDGFEFGKLKFLVYDTIYEVPVTYSAT